MEVSRLSLEQVFRDLSDAELLTRYTRGDMTELGREVAREELHKRGISSPPITAADTAKIADESATNINSPGSHALEVLTRFWSPTEAFLLQSLLVAEGVPAVVADANTVQTYQLWANALDGVRVLVPAAFLAQARTIQTAFANGDFAIDDSTDYHADIQE